VPKVSLWEKLKGRTLTEVLPNCGWEDSITLFKLFYQITKNFPFELSKSRNNILDAAHSISRNIHPVK